MTGIAPQSDALYFGRSSVISPTYISLKPVVSRSFIVRPVSIRCIQSSLIIYLAFGTSLFGITMVQSWIYFNTNKDRWYLRLLVSLMFYNWGERETDVNQVAVLMWVTNTCQVECILKPSVAAS